MDDEHHTTLNIQEIDTILFFDVEEIAKVLNGTQGQFSLFYLESRIIYVNMHGFYFLLNIENNYNDVYIKIREDGVIFSTRFIDGTVYLFGLGY